MSDPIRDLKRELLAAAERQLEQAEIASAGVPRKNRRRWLERSYMQGGRRRLVALAAAALLVVVTATSAFAMHALFVGKGLIGLAPVGATPSTPEKGELVLAFTFGHTMGDPGRFRVLMYADGWFITERLGDVSHADESTGLVQQRLTPEGVELVRAEVISTGLGDNGDLHLQGGPGLYFGKIELRTGNRFVHVTWGDIGGQYSDVAREMPTAEQVSALIRLDARLADPASWLPASAWDDPEITAYVPFGYSVCYEGQPGVGLSRVLASLPRAAEDLLRTQGPTQGEYTNLVGTFVYWCSDLTNDEARELARILDDSGLHGWESVFSLRYGESGATLVSLDFSPLLPDEN